MRTVGAYEAKTHLPQLLERVAKGERVTITRHGVAVAVLQPPDRQRTRRPEDVITQLREFRKNRTLGGITIREMIEEGRR